MGYKHKIAYVSRVIYPKPVAHALQTIRMAAAFADHTGDAHLFVRGLTTSQEHIRRQYAIGDSPLRIWSLRANRLPQRLRRYYDHPFSYNSMIAAILGLHPTWWGGDGQRKVLFVRSLRELLYWGLARRHLWWMSDWAFVYEAHDVAGLDPSASLEENPFDVPDGSEGRPRQRLLRALCNYDLIVCVTQALADDLRRWTNGTLQPYVVRHASALPRLPRPPELRPFGDRVVLGYIGTIDRERGVDSLIAAMRWLPKQFVLRLVGRIPERRSNGQRPAWLDDLLNEPTIRGKVELVPPVPISQVVQEIDLCDILLQPASDDIISIRYRAPLKLFDYMIRGKPIVAADVACHRELLQDNVNACLYRHGDAQHLAACIMSLVEHPQQAEVIARTAWEQSAEYTYDARARHILELIDEVWERRHAADSA